MVSPFHKLKNAETALNNVRNDPRVEIINISESLGEATVEFRFRDDASLKAVRGVQENLERNGFEEVDEQSELRGTVRYEFDKMRLTED